MKRFVILYTFGGMIKFSKSWIGHQETMEMAMQMVRFTCIVFAHLIWTSYLMYSITFAIDETDLHVQSLDSGTTEGVGEASDTELAPRDEQG